MHTLLKQGRLRLSYFEPVSFQLPGAKFSARLRAGLSWPLPLLPKQPFLEDSVAVWVHVRCRGVVVALAVSLDVLWRKEGLLTERKKDELGRRKERRNK